MLKNPNVYDCSVIELPKIENRAGNITPIHPELMYRLIFGEYFIRLTSRWRSSCGAHAHKECHQFLIAMSGSFEVVLDDGMNKRTVLLNRPFYGLHIPPGIWASEQSFSSGSICLVLASEGYIEDDYIRDYNNFIEYKNGE